MSKNLKGSILLIVAAIVWGSAFVAQEELAYIGSFTTSGIRFTIGGLVLLPVIAISSNYNKKHNPTQYKKPFSKATVLGGLMCGLVLAVASNLQQIGIIFNADIAEGDSGKAGFITALYIVIVPILGVFFKKRITPAMIIGVLVAVGGLYFISVKSGFSIAVGDVFIFLCAFAFAGHILSVDFWQDKTSGLALSSMQFFVAGAVSTVLMFIFEEPDIHLILKATIPLLYMGLMSSGVAYTLQVIGQKFCEPTIASVIMSLEALFALIFASLYYGKLPTLREGIGCALMLIAILVVETPFVDRLFGRKVKQNDTV